jgi:transcriptional regulator with XRE-family HTH domain
MKTQRRLRQLRVAANLTQQELGNLTEPPIHPSRISHFECGHARPFRGEALRLSAALDFDDPERLMDEVEGDD